MTGVLPLTSYQAPLEHLAKPYHQLHLVRDGQPFIYDRDNGVVAWTGPKLVVRGMVDEGFVSVASSNEKETVCEISVTGLAAHNSFQTEVAMLRIKVQELEQEIIDLKAMGMQDFLEEQRTADEALDPEKYRHLRRALTNQEYRIFELMASRPGHTMEKGYIHEAVMNPETEVKIVDVMVCKLRKKLKKHMPEAAVKTDWGRGYYVEMEESNAGTLAEVD